VKRRVVSIAFLLLIAAIGLYWIELATPKRDFFIERKGVLLRSDRAVSAEVGEIHETLELESSTGLVVEMRVLRPADEADRKYPLLLMVGGHRTGKDAVDLVGAPQRIAYAAIDYPYRGSHSLDGFWQSIAAAPKIQDAFLDTPPALSLALDWLLDQPWVDVRNVNLVGVSLGVPFAAVAGGLDTRFTQVFLLHGGGDNLSWVMHAGRNSIENETLRRLAARGALLLVYGNSFDTRQWIRQIAPRPLVVVAAHDDDYVPQASQEPLIEAAKSESVELVWTEGLHIDPERQIELGQLLEIVRSRIRAPE